MSRLKVKGHDNLVRDVNSNAIIQTSISDYKLYMKRIKMRENSQDQIRSAVKEINTLKAELREIKDLIKGLKN